MQLCTKFAYWYRNTKIKFCDPSVSELVVTDNPPPQLGRELAYELTNTLQGEGLVYIHLYTRYYILSHSFYRKFICFVSCHLFFETPTILSVFVELSSDFLQSIVISSLNLLKNCFQFFFSRILWEFSDVNGGLGKYLNMLFLFFIKLHVGLQYPTLVTDFYK